MLNKIIKRRFFLSKSTKVLLVALVFFLLFALLITVRTNANYAKAYYHSNFLLFNFPTNSKPEYLVRTVLDKNTVQASDNFQITIEVENTSNQVINNFEIRIPFLRTIQNAQFIQESPSFNKILNSSEYPQGFNNRSWLINTFIPNDKRSFRLSFKANQSNTNEALIYSSFTLPPDWQDPNQLQSNVLQKLTYLRLDIYLNSVYDQSLQTFLPSYESIAAPVSKVQLPSQYTFTGSKTTDLSKINTSNHQAVANFTLDTADVTLEFQQPIDLSSEQAIDILTNLDSYLEPSWGKLVLKKEIPFLKGVPVRVTFKNTNFAIEPKFRIYFSNNRNSIFSINDLKGNFSRDSSSIELNEISYVAITPDIQTDKGIYETKEDRAEIKAKVTDPTASLHYKIGENAFPISVIDNVTGEFSIRIDLKNNEVVSLEIVAKLKNGESYSQNVIVKNVTEQSVPEADEPETISMPINFFSIILIVASIILLIIITITIILILKRRNKKTLKENITTISNTPEMDDPNLFPTNLENIHVKLKDERISKDKFN